MFSKPTQLNLNIKCTLGNEGYFHQPTIEFIPNNQKHPNQYSIKKSEKHFQTVQNTQKLKKRCINTKQIKFSIKADKLSKENDIIRKQAYQKIQLIQKLGNQSNNFQIIEYINGDKYYGQVYELQQEQIRAGQGLLQFTNGDFCYGDWKDDLLHGYATYIFYNQTRYEGEFDQGCRQGYGILKSPQGDWYEGYWQKNMRNGYGKQYFNHSQQLYEGQFLDDKRNGQGMTTMKSGNIFSGQYKQNKKHGRGFIKYSSGDVFTGQWHDDEIFSKNCDMKFLNGDHFHGEYRNGVRVGYGKYTFENGQIIEGQWYGDSCCKGKIIYLNGDLYEGQIKYGKKYGLGQYLYENGDEYRGYWENDKKHGEGQFWQIQGEAYSGYWHNGEYLKQPYSHKIYKQNQNKYITPKKTGRHAQYFS